MNTLFPRRRFCAGLVGSLMLAWVSLAPAATPTLQDFGYGHKLARSSWPTLVIMVDFEDGKFPNNNTNYWDRFVFKRTNSPPGIGTYFGEVSLDRFAFIRGGTIRITESVTNRWQGWRNRTETDGLADLNYHSNLMHQAIASGQFDFAAYDFNGNGYVTADEMLILLLIADEGGGTRNAGKVRPPGHSVGWSGTVSTGNVTRWDWFAVIAHELSHLLGAVDLYGIWGTDQDLNVGLSLMGSGTTAQPTHLDPWHKMQLGWCEPRIRSLRAGGTDVMPCAQLGRVDAPILYYDPDRGDQEFWLLEYRTQNSSANNYFENGMGNGTNGMLLWHVFQDPNKNPPFYGDLVYPDAENNWYECTNCRSLYQLNGTSLVCTSTNQVHAPFASDHHRVVKNVPDDPGQHGWRFCTRCSQLFYSPAGNAGVCPAGGVHISSGADYSLALNVPDVVGHNGWRQCINCQTLFYPIAHGDLAPSVCPAKTSGAPHQANTNLYVLIAGWSDYAMLAEGLLPSTNGPQFLLGGNGVWPTNTTTPYLSFYDKTSTRFRVQIGPYADGADTLTLTALSEYDTWVDFAYKGTEKGTPDQPYNTFAEGVTNVGFGGNIKIKTGVSSETSHVTKHMFIQASGGPATIGRR